MYANARKRAKMSNVIAFHPPKSALILLYEVVVEQVD